MKLKKQHDFSMKNENKLLLELIDKNCPSWINRPDPSWDKIKILQYIIDQVLPGILKIEIGYLDHEKIIGTIPYRKTTANVVGYLHGGSIYSLGDTLAGAFIWSKSDGTHFAVTRKSEIRYLRPFKIGILRCTVKEKSRSGRKILLTANYQDEDGKKITEVDMEYIQIASKIV